MFNIGDKVYSKKTGLPGVGTVAGIIEGQRYFNIFFKGQVHGLWQQLYPGCAEKYVITVKYEKPQYACSLEEYCKQFVVKPTPEVIKIYKLTTKCQTHLDYPQDDLELFHE